MALLDPHGRSINYLRLSVTDRCNLRCRYCMPAKGLGKVRRDEIFYAIKHPEVLQILDLAEQIMANEISGRHKLLKAV